MTVRLRCFTLILLVLSVLSLSLCSCSAQLRDASDASRPVKREIAAAAPETEPETEAPATDAVPETEPTPETDAETEPYVPTDEERAREILSSMTTEEKVGQLFLVGMSGDYAAFAEEHHIGGIVFFAKDFENETPETFAAFTDSLQAASKIPLLLAVDEEGGTVVRVSKFPAFRSEPFKSPRELFANGRFNDADENGVYDGIDAIISDTAEKAELLNSIGINVNLAPVADIAAETGAFMYDRSLGEDAETTAMFTEAAVKTAMHYSVGSVLKHFPGYGVNSDTHTGTAVDSRPYETFTESDFLPFAAGIAAAPAAVMVNHNIVEAFDTETSASLSSKVISALRGYLGFTGVIMTDDLGMAAVSEAVSEAGTYSAAVLAFLAGNDMICTTLPEEIADVIAAVEDGTITAERLDESVTRVLLWKIALGLI